MKKFTDAINEVKELTLEEKLKLYFEKTVKLTDNNLAQLEGVDDFINGITTMIERREFKTLNETNSYQYNRYAHRFKVYKVDQKELKNSNLSEDMKKALNKELQSSSGLLCIYAETLDEVRVYGAFTDNFIDTTVVVPRKILIDVS